MWTNLLLKFSVMLTVSLFNLSLYEATMQKKSSLALWTWVFIFCLGLVWYDTFVITEASEVPPNSYPLTLARNQDQESYQ